MEFQEDEKERAARHQMVEKQLVERGVTDRLVLDAMRVVPRHLFVPGDFEKRAYDDISIPLALDARILQPFLIAVMLQNLALGPHHRVLQVGTGSGYVTAIMSLLCDHVFSIEIDPLLAQSARKRLEYLQCSNVTIRQGSGLEGWSEAAPFDAILLDAAVPEIPRPLVRELADGGRFIVPLGTKPQRLLCLNKQGESLEEEDLGAVRLLMART